MPGGESERLVRIPNCEVKARPPEPIWVEAGGFAENPSVLALPTIGRALKRCVALSIGALTAVVRPAAQWLRRAGER